MKDKKKRVLYVGKASSLLRRVSSYFIGTHDARIEDLVSHIRFISYIEKKSGLEALILEANLIKAYWPPYNIREKDNRSFLYLVITRDPFPKPLLVRGTELDSRPRAYRAVFGPYMSPRSLRAALDQLRHVFPWSTCEPGQRKACFISHLGLCPGVCVGSIDRRAYAKIIRDLMHVFEGKQNIVLRAYTHAMREASRSRRYEEARQYRDRVRAFEHIRDIALLKREDAEMDRIKPNEMSVCFDGRIEGYDISHISGTAMVASMVVFENREPLKVAYRRFRIMSLAGPDDVSALRETLVRRTRHVEWPQPDIILIDGGIAQVHAAEAAIHQADWSVPVIGMAKGPERKRTDIVCSMENLALREACASYEGVLARVRDEAHRFAIQYHRTVRRKLFIPS